MWIFSADHYHRIEHLLEQQLHVLKQILHALNPHANHFVITQIGEIMPTQSPVVGIAIGATGTFLATPVDASGNTVTLPAGIVPTWTSSDTTNAPVVPSADGLTVTVSVPSTAPTTLVGTTFTLSLAATLANGTVVTGTVNVPFLSASTGTVASFVITQLS